MYCGLHDVDSHCGGPELFWDLGKRAIRRWAWAGRVLRHGTVVVGRHLGRVEDGLEDCNLRW